MMIYDLNFLDGTELFIGQFPNRELKRYDCLPSDSVTLTIPDSEANEETSDYQKVAH